MITAAIVLGFIIAVVSGAALLAWLYLRFFPDRPRRLPPEEPRVRSLGLDLR